MSSRETTPKIIDTTVELRTKELKNHSVLLVWEQCSKEAERCEIEDSLLLCM